jgi:hypothetical protein
MNLKTKLFSLALLLFACCAAQTEVIHVAKPKPKIEIRLMTQKEPPDTLYVIGENFLHIQASVHSVSDLSESEKLELFEAAVKADCHIVYIDTEGLWDSPQMPSLASQNKLYYYYVMQKKKD